MEGFFAGESVPVNQKLSDMLLQLHISERTGRGVPKITEVYGKGTYEFRENSIVVSIPFIRVSTEDEDPRWTQDRTQDGTQEDSKGSSEDEKIKRILEFCQTPKGILEITEMLGYSGRKPTKKYVKPLVEQGRLAMTIPDKPQSKNQIWERHIHAICRHQFSRMCRKHPKWDGFYSPVFPKQYPHLFTHKY